MTLTRRDFFKGSAAATVAIGAVAVTGVLNGDETLAKAIPPIDLDLRWFQWRLIEEFRGVERQITELWATANMAGAEIFEPDLWPRIYLFQPPKGRGRIIRKFGLFNGEQQICILPINQTINHGDTLQVEVEEVTIE